MTDWNIQQMRDAVANKQSFVLGNATEEEVWAYLELPEADQDNPDIPEPDAMLVDIQTANLLVTVHEALSEQQRDKFLGLSVERAVDVAWRLVK
jgi:hypothetical protein